MAINTINRKSSSENEVPYNPSPYYGGASDKPRFVSGRSDTSVSDSSTYSSSSTHSIKNWIKSPFRNRRDSNSSDTSVSSIEGGSDTGAQQHTNGKTHSRNSSSSSGLFGQIKSKMGIHNHSSNQSQHEDSADDGYYTAHVAPLTIEEVDDLVTKHTGKEYQDRILISYCDTAVPEYPDSGKHMQETQLPQPPQSPPSKFKPSTSRQNSDPLPIRNDTKPNNVPTTAIPNQATPSPGPSKCEIYQKRIEQGHLEDLLLMPPRCDEYVRRKQEEKRRQAECQRDLELDLEPLSEKERFRREPPSREKCQKANETIKDRNREYREALGSDRDLRLGVDIDTNMSPMVGYTSA